MKLLREILSLLLASFNRWRESKAPRLAAALAYYTLFSLAPLLILIVALAGFFLNPSTAAAEVEALIQSSLGEGTATAVAALVGSLDQTSSGISATIFSVVILLIGASNVFNQLQTALNTIWQVEPRPDRGHWLNIKDRLTSLSMIFLVGLLLLSTFLLDAGLNLLSPLLETEPLVQLPIWNTFHNIFSFVNSIVLIAIMYKTLPNAKIAWRDALIGAAITSLLLGFGGTLIGVYFRLVGSAYAAASSLVLLLLWIYYAAQIFFFGAAFTQVYADRHGQAVQRPQRRSKPVGVDKGEAAL